MKFFAALLLLSISLVSYSQKIKADLIITGATIYTVDASFSTATAMVVTNGKITATGSDKKIKERYQSEKNIDARGQFVYPGLIDAHGHFYRYALGLETANLYATGSWSEVIDRLKDLVKVQQIQKGSWILGRGWDQNDWAVKEFPTKEELDRAFPGNPVLLYRIDGHAAVANQEALDLAGVSAGQTLTGGTVEVKNGTLTGLLIDNAVDLVSSKIPPPGDVKKTTLLQQAQRNCFAFGLTTVDDCGIEFGEALFMDSLQKAGILKMRVYAMLSDAKHNYDFLFKKGIINTGRMHVRSFKVYADGALGSRGACLIHDYSDKPGWKGFLLSSPQHFDSVARILSGTPFQMCTHAIGDSGNRAILNIYGKYLKRKNDKRWRIEHAQVVNESDFKLFGKYSVIPSVQPTHATSDMYWASERLGNRRVRGAYAYRQLKEQNGWIPLGTDFPVEDISPFKTFLAAVFRVDSKNYPEGGFQKENALSRKDALRGMTIWAARSNFEEKEKGSLEKGKMADFVILDTDLMKAGAGAVLNTKVIATYLAGEKVYSNE